MTDSFNFTNVLGLAIGIAGPLVNPGFSKAGCSETGTTVPGRTGMEPPLSRRPNRTQRIPNTIRKPNRSEQNPNNQNNRFGSGQAAISFPAKL